MYTVFQRFSDTVANTRTTTSLEEESISWWLNYQRVKLAMQRNFSVRPFLSLSLSLSSFSLSLSSLIDKSQEFEM